MPIQSSIQELIPHLRRLPLLTQIHARLRLWSFPFTTVAKYVPVRGDILDYGAGFGLFSFLLAHRYPKRRIIAYDISPPKVTVAKKLLSEFPQVMVTKSLVASRHHTLTCVVVLDVSYLLSPQRKETFLGEIFSLLKPNSTLLWSIVPREFSWRYYLAWLQEWLMVQVLRLTQTTDTVLDFETVPWAKATLKKIGFTHITVHSLPALWPFFHRHLLVVARKP